MEKPENLLAQRHEARAYDLQIWIDDGGDAEFGYTHSALVREQEFFLETAAELRRLTAQRDALLEALIECLPYVSLALTETGSMDAYHTEVKVYAAIKAVEE